METYVASLHLSFLPSGNFLVILGIIVIGIVIDPEMGGGRGIILSGSEFRGRCGRRL